MYDKRLYNELDELPTQVESQADDLKIDTRKLSVGVSTPPGVDALLVWTSRVEPGTIEAERYIDGKYVPGTDDDITVAVAAARLDGLL